MLVILNVKAHLVCQYIRFANNKKKEKLGQSSLGLSKPWLIVNVFEVLQLNLEYENLESRNV